MSTVSSVFLPFRIYECMQQFSTRRGRCNTGHVMIPHTMHDPHLCSVERSALLCCMQQHSHTLTHTRAYAHIHTHMHDIAKVKLHTDIFFT